MDNDLSNGAGLLKHEWESIRDKKVKLTPQEYQRLQARTNIYYLDNLVQTRIEIDKLKKDNWVGIIKQHPRFSASAVIFYNALLISDIRHPFLNWVSAIIIQLFGL